MALHQLFWRTAQCVERRRLRSASATNASDAGNAKLVARVPLALQPLSPSPSLGVPLSAFGVPLSAFGVLSSGDGGSSGLLASLDSPSPVAASVDASGSEGTGGTHPAIAACVQPLAAEHVSVVHRLASSQLPQAVQAVAPAAEKVPTAQAVHVVAPAALEKVPAAHDAQTVLAEAEHADV